MELRNNFNPLVGFSVITNVVGNRKAQEDTPRVIESTLGLISND